MGFFGDLKDDVVEFVRNPTDEQKILVVAALAIAVADRGLYFVDFPFVVRTTAAVDPRSGGVPNRLYTRRRN